MIGDDEAPSRSGNPRPAEPKRQTSSTESPPDSNTEAADSAAQEKQGLSESVTIELPTDVRVKLRKLDKFESKYHGSCLHELGQVPV